MGGNVAEWTVDQYHEDYLERLEGDPAVNPKFIPEELYPRSVRGGSWMDDADQLRCARSEEHTSELQSRGHLVCRLLLEKKNKTTKRRELRTRINRTEW